MHGIQKALERVPFFYVFSQEPLFPPLLQKCHSGNIIPASEASRHFIRRSAFGSVFRILVGKPCEHDLHFILGGIHGKREILRFGSTIRSSITISHAKRISEVRERERFRSLRIHDSYRIGIRIDFYDRNGSIRTGTASNHVHGIIVSRDVQWVLYSTFRGEADVLVGTFIHISSPTYVQFGFDSARRFPRRKA